MKETYNNKTDQVAYDRGYLDGLQGVKAARIGENLGPYMSGHEDGHAERAEKIHNSRVENIKKIRSKKNG